LTPNRRTEQSTVCREFIFLKRETRKLDYQEATHSETSKKEEKSKATMKSSLQKYNPFAEKKTPKERAKEARRETRKEVRVS